MEGGKGELSLRPFDGLMAGKLPSTHSGQTGQGIEYGGLRNSLHQRTCAQVHYIFSSTFHFSLFT